MIWEPIDTAPKDGTPILAFRYGELAVVEWYESPIPMWSRWKLVVSGGGDGEDDEFTPELWSKIDPPKR